MKPNFADDYPNKIEPKIKTFEPYIGTGFEAGKTEHDKLLEIINSTIVNKKNLGPSSELYGR